MCVHVRAHTRTHTHITLYYPFPPYSALVLVFFMVFTTAVIFLSISLS